ncbi:MAG TPA: bifunctional histidinol-phosphatase/imidazoleglycerol-phosphate dehydratase HisB [Saprospiraceae bacterium]|nr:bifunctional histidinol-phosphatase/imidazoleglycerol-phosphate dehydratase HisB [Lewinellaceae bacterium]HPG08368.1 bifunctional histidinol-phosphatase/imidazoleglycerol-phosphate dehydratase HisB [Saprospiraceae bacterium]HQU54372.1 bifunctional histidinol-phosphatase/imidazoleglycerol-phosphate dehydratase HisB [Saprospiraceae bacterium]HRV87245.1 bifunctional histidinol-phosphatase/imidazoleglycerol-phosphate dehydratase HisB [Saprospiraceae bacterium]
MGKKVLFIDRDGTLIKEPFDYQVDSLEKLVFVPGVFTWLGRIARELDFELVMITNQDGLGTPSFPESDFWPAQQKMLEAIAGEGIHFDAIFIDRTLPEENAPTRKPGTALLTGYLTGDYDLSHSFVIGDRETDLMLARNLGCQGIHIRPLDPVLKDITLETITALTTDSWEAIYRLLKLGTRTVEIRRTTKETDVLIQLNLDGSGKSVIATGLGFFDHMLDQIARHAGIDLTVKVDGDLEVDEHHTIEDTALALGEAFRKTLGDKKGLQRYGFYLPMDDSLAHVGIDFGGRPWLVWDAEFRRERIGDVPTELFFHFFKSFTDTAACNLNIRCTGDNEHHKIESIFKAFARAIRMAIRRDPADDSLPTTKGTL